MGATILVVEDNELNRRLFTHILKLSEFDVAEAADGASALTMVAAVEPDLVMLDMDLPRLPGLEVARRLRSDARFSHIPILAVSAFVTGETETRARALGCIGYLKKPVGPSALIEAVRQALSSPGLRHAAPGA